ncbi:rhodanese-like domain-containing protein [Litoreibacter roseus]|uniref:Sulfurtransferase n=1 Tax=Litoreibacter roseus TaxID=2601869 RepID=A0A6N6JF61_9RHOB|nr:rhodanese-like domain-containing protein [Litoreibacter roseus]GFE64430.1 sulfurtransferase [Litoreibacter roseus]
MGTDSDPRVSEAMPTEAWDRLKADETAVLVDVRTASEWSFVGCPDLSELGCSMHCIEWAKFPDMIPNPRFVEEVMEALDGQTPSQIFFICRSGARSKSAAVAVENALGEKGVQSRCVNVAEGFEGDLNAKKHRGGLNGWKARGLPWKQS